jgi:hypothetical protein
MKNFPPPSYETTQRAEIDRRQAQFGSEAEGAPLRQHEAVARCQPHRIHRALDREPAFSRNNGIALDASVLRELQA